MSETEEWRSSSSSSSSSSSNHIARIHGPKVVKAASATEPAILTASITIPYSRLSFVRGVDELRLNGIRRLSNAKIHLLGRQTDVRGDVNMSIVGSAESVDWAKYLIAAAVAGQEPIMALGKAIPPGVCESSSSRIGSGSLFDL